MRLTTRRARPLRQSLASDFGVRVDLRVLALTPEQIAAHELPPAALSAEGEAEAEGEQ